MRLSGRTYAVVKPGSKFCASAAGVLVNIGWDIMGIVRFALRFPHTFYVLAALILFLGAVAVRTMPSDIFPEIRIPVVSVIWRCTGLSTPEMEQRVEPFNHYAM